MKLEEIYLDDNYDEISGLEILNVHPNVKKINFTADDFDEFISNFEKYSGEKKPHLKIDHTGQQAVLKALTGKNYEEGTELPNLGYIKRMYHNGKSLYADVENIPSKLKNVVFKMFKAISPEATWNYRGSGDKLITALSLTNNPAQKHVLDVHMNESTDDKINMVDEDNMVVCFSGDIKIEGEYIMSKENKDMNKVANDDKSAVVNEDTKAVVQSFSEKILSGIKEIVKSEPKKLVEEGATQSVALSEYQELEGKFKEMKGNMEQMNGVVNDLRLSLIQKEQEQANFSEQIEEIQLRTRKEKAGAICQQAVLDGVPPVVVNYFKPILLSEKGDQAIKLSEKIDGEIVEAEKKLSEMIKGFFKIYPNKVDFSDRMSTADSLEEPGNDESIQLSEINKRAEELISQGMSRLEALEQAGLELARKKGGV